MTPYAKNLAEHRRIAILKLLLESQGSANESILKDALDELGLSALLTRQAVRDDLEFLALHGAIKLTWYETLAIARITERGVDIAQGKAFVDGIKHPAIGA